MPDGPLFPRNPLAGRDAAFRDAAGNNPFRDADGPVEAEIVDGIAGTAAGNTAVRGDSATAPTSRFDGASAYAVAGAPGVRRPQRGDFEPTLPSQAGALILHGTICLAVLALAWFMLTLVVLILGSWGWAAFFIVWFALTGFVGIRSVVVAWGEWNAIRLGAMPESARSNVKLALILAWIVCGVSFVGLIVGAVPLVRELV